jgi:phage shock protein PspC (stress-responsive transcriptional regulator)
MSTDETPRPGFPGHDPGTAPPAGEVPPQPGAQAPRGGFFDSIRRVGIARSDDRWVGGVAAGVAERFRLDPLLVRGLLILSFFLTGAGFVVYALAWALLPERRDGRIHLQEATRGHLDVALLGAAVTLVIGFAWSDGPWSWWGGIFDWVEALLWIAIWVGVVVLVVKLVRDRRARTTGAGAAAPPVATGTPGAPGGPATSFASESVPATQPYTPAPPAPYVAEAYSHAPGAAGAPYAPYAAPPAPPAPVPEPRPRIQGPGARMFGVVMGLVLLAGALLLVVDRAGDLGMSFWGAWLGAAVVIVGAGIIASGLRGRRGGGLTALGILGMIAALAYWPFADERRAFVWDGPPEASVVSSGVVTLDTIAEATDGVHIQFGAATIDLTELDLSDVEVGNPISVPVSMAAGATTIVIPDDAAVEADVRLVAGNVTWSADGEYRTAAGITADPARFRTAEVDELGGAQLLLEIDGRAGDITIRENR